MLGLLVGNTGTKTILKELQSLSSVTFDQCRQACDESLQCMGFSFGVISPMVAAADERRHLLQSSGTGDCYLMTTSPTAVDTATQYTGSATCYAKGDHTASDGDTCRLVAQGYA